MSRLRDIAKPIPYVICTGNDSELFTESQRLEQKIRVNLEALEYGE